MVLQVVYKKARKKYLVMAYHTPTILKKGAQGEMQSHNHAVLSPRYQVVFLLLRQRTRHSTASICAYIE